jgi:hypothetical protein
MGHPIVAQNGGGIFLFFWRGGVRVFAGVFAKNGVQNVVF